MALAVPLSRFTSRAGGGSALFVRPLMRAPSTRTLAVVAFISVLGTAIFPPTEPHMVPLLGPDGNTMTGADGKMLMHGGVLTFDVETITCLAFFFVFAVCMLWLFVRFIRFLYDHWKYRRRVA